VQTRLPVDRMFLSRAGPLWRRPSARSLDMLTLRQLGEKGTAPVPYRHRSTFPAAAPALRLSKARAVQRSGDTRTPNFQCQDPAHPCKRFAVMSPNPFRHIYGEFRGPMLLAAVPEHRAAHAWSATSAAIAKPLPFVSPLWRQHVCSAQAEPWGGSDSSDTVE